MSKPRYYVLTWDPNRGEFTPQRGVRSGPYSLFGLRRALRKLEALPLRYTVRPREAAVSVHVYRKDN